jgi:hypothetical protein
MENNLPSWEETEAIEPELPSFEDTKEIEQISPLETGLRSAAQSASFSFSDELEAGLRAAWDASTSEDDFMDKYRQIKDRINTRMAEGEEQNPKSAIAGSLLGALAPIPGTGLKALGTGIKGAIKRGTAQGAAYSAGTADTMADVPSNMVQGGIIGGAMGGVLEPIAGRLFKPSVQRTVAAKAEEKAAIGSLKAAGISPAQWEKFESMPAKAGVKTENRLNALGKEMIDNKIVTLSSRPADMFDKVKNRIGELEGQMDNLAEQVTYKVKPTELEAHLLSAKESLKNKSDIKRLGKISGDDLDKVFDEIADDIKNYPNQLSLQDIRQVRKNLSDKINFEKSKSSGKDLILKDVRASLTDYMKRIYEANGLKNEFTKLDDSYSKLRDISKILSKSSSKQKAGVGMPGLMAGTAASLVGSALGPAGVPVGFIAGLGGYEVIRRYGKQAMVSGNRSYAKKLNKLANSYDKLSPSLQKTIDTAAQRGPQAIIATTFLMQQQDKKFRSLMEDEQE